MDRFDCIYTWMVSYMDSQQGLSCDFTVTDTKNSKSHPHNY